MAEPRLEFKFLLPFLPGSFQNLVHDATTFKSVVTPHLKKTPLPLPGHSLRDARLRALILLCLQVQLADTYYSLISKWKSLCQHHSTRQTDCVDQELKKQ